MANLFFTIVIQGLITAYFLFQRERRTYMLINLYLLVVCADFLFEILVFHLFEGETGYLDLMPGSFRLLKGPLLFLFARQVTGKSISFRMSLPFLLPFLILFVYNIVLLVAVMADLPQQQWLLQGYTICFSYYLYYWVGFLLSTLYQLNAYVGEESKTIKGLRALISYIIVMVVIYFFAIKWGVDRELVRHIYTYSFLPQFALILRVRFNKEKLADKAFQTQSKALYKNSVLKEVDITDLSVRIREAMEKGKLFLNEDVALDDLATYLQCPKHHITEALTKGLRSTFYDLINSYRLKEVMRLMAEEQQEPLSDIYFRCGFKSKTTFYKYFKLKTGVSPAEYRSRLIKEMSC